MRRDIEALAVVDPEDRRGGAMFGLPKGEEGRPSAVDAAAKRLMRIKAELKRLEQKVAG
jgi:hypothetical protein